MGSNIDPTTGVEIGAVQGEYVSSTDVSNFAASAQNISNDLKNYQLQQSNIVDQNDILNGITANYGLSDPAWLPPGSADQAAAQGAINQINGSQNKITEALNDIGVNLSQLQGMYNNGQMEASMAQYYGAILQFLSVGGITNTSQISSTQINSVLKSTLEFQNLLASTDANGNPTPISLINLLTTSTISNSISNATLTLGDMTINLATDYYNNYAGQLQQLEGALNISNSALGVLTNIRNAGNDYTNAAVPQFQYGDPLWPDVPASYNSPLGVVGNATVDDARTLIAARDSLSNILSEMGQDNQGQSSQLQTIYNELVKDFPLATYPAGIGSTVSSLAAFLDEPHQSTYNPGNGESVIPTTLIPTTAPSNPFYIPSYNAPTQNQLDRVISAKMNEYENDVLASLSTNYNIHLSAHDVVSHVHTESIDYLTFNNGFRISVLNNGDSNVADSQTNSKGQYVVAYNMTVVVSDTTAPYNFSKNTAIVASTVNTSQLLSNANDYIQDLNAPGAQNTDETDLQNAMTGWQNLSQTQSDNLKTSQTLMEEVWDLLLSISDSLNTAVKSSSSVLNR